MCGADFPPGGAKRTTIIPKAGVTSVTRVTAAFDAANGAGQLSSLTSSALLFPLTLPSLLLFRESALP